MATMEHEGKTWDVVGRDRTRSGWVTYLMRTDENGKTQKASLFAANRSHDASPKPNAGPRARVDARGRRLR